LGELIVKRANYAARQRTAIDGVRGRLAVPFFKEYVVNINAGLKARGECSAGTICRASSPKLAKARSIVLRKSTAKTTSIGSPAHFGRF
jgi:hypothetical protein